MSKKVTEFRFPRRFLWGVSTSAHQVEGGNHNNWTVWELENARTQAKSAEYKIGHLPIWSEVKNQATQPENYVSGLAVDHFNRYEADFDIVKKMNLNAFRFSVEWSRIEPEEGVWDAKAIDHYRRYIKALKARGIEPLLTLYHWTTPVWFSQKGGFEKARNIKHFVHFAEKILTEFGKELRYITTVNEPDTVAFHGYYSQDHPPQKQSLWKMVWVYRNHLKAHKEVYKSARRLSRRFKVGFVKSYVCVLPLNNKRSSRLAVWLNTLVRDRLVLRYVGTKQDFIGVNYYFTDIYDGWKRQAPSQAVSDLGWEMFPNNLESVLRRLGKYKKPLIVMETGVADRNDQFRKNWLNGTIRAVNAVLQEGVDVQGYLYWSLLDNFEWAYGRWPRFGLVEVDYDDDLKRLPRKSALYYAAFVKKARGL